MDYVIGSDGTSIHYASCQKTYSYNATSGKLETESLYYQGKVFKKTYTYNGSNQLVSESLFVLQ